MHYKIPDEGPLGAACSTPTNTNLTAPTNYKFSIKRIPNMVYFCTGVSLPGWTNPTINIPTGVPGGRNTFRAKSESVSHGDASFRFIINENYSNYDEVARWFRECVGLKDFGPVEWRNWMSEEGYLLVLSNRKNPVFRITFRGLFPTGISEIAYKANDTEGVPLVATVTMGFTYYTYESLTNP
jgi:hypothetical protein